MPSALRAAGAMVALLVFSFQDVAAAGKNTCDTEHAIDAKSQRERKLLQANTSAKVVAAEVEKIVQCRCETVKKYGKCYNHGNGAFRVSKCEEITSRNACEDFKKKKHGKHAGKHPCKWIPTPSPTPRPTPVPPTPEPTPAPTSCLSTLPPQSTYKETLNAKCRAGSSTSRVDTWAFGIATGDGRVDPDCERICNWFPWCRAYTQGWISNHFNGRWQPYRKYTCDMLVDEQIWAADPVVAAEKEKAAAEGRSYPSDNEGQPRKFVFPNPCPQDLDLFGKELQLSNRCSSGCDQKYDENIYGDGGTYDAAPSETSKNKVYWNCYQKE